MAGCPRGHRRRLADLLDLRLGHLLWYADAAGMQRRTAGQSLRLYRYRWLQRPGRPPRLLEIPTPRGCAGRSAPCSTVSSD
ncbi:MAG: hypothetical protein WKF47_05275 [Geodermatophilaceae bacterium]